MTAAQKSETRPDLRVATIGTNQLSNFGLGEIRTLDNAASGEVELRQLLRRGLSVASDDDLAAMPSRRLQCSRQRQPDTSIFDVI